jgi:hypothetical protein
MNVSEAAVKELGYDKKFAFYEERYAHVLGSPAKTLVCTETWQTEDYSRYEMSKFDGDARKKRREEVFPRDLKRAFEMGLELAG